MAQPIGLIKVQSDEGIFLIEVLACQVTLSCVKLTKNNYNNKENKNKNNSNKKPCPAQLCYSYPFVFSLDSLNLESS